MIVEEIFSPINDIYIRQNLQKSPIWKNCYKKDEQFPKSPMWKYTIKFNRLVPVQVMKVQEWHSNKITKS